MSGAGVLWIPAGLLLGALAMLGLSVRQLSREDRARARGLEAAFRRPDVREGAPHA